jgi:hypothetical protein
MNKNKNSHEHKHKTKHDKTNTKNKKQFRNRCLVNDNNEIDATNREIIDKIELDTKKIQISSEVEEVNEDNTNSPQELENNSDSDEEEGTEINKENFNIKLCMLVFTN